MRTGPQDAEAVVWHDVECRAYDADLPLWRGLAEEAGDPVLELGAGTGRVSLDLAQRGHAVSALESDPALARALARRARERGLRVGAHVGDARAFELHRRFALVAAPMQLVQLLSGRKGRRSMLIAARRHLSPGGLLAAALADPLEGVPADSALPPLPDVRETGGWVYSSRPIAIRAEERHIMIERLREAVSPGGELRQSAAVVRLDRVDPDELAADAEELGFRPLEPRAVPATEAYVGSVVVVLETR
jgi:SAM-dependent methyltransferase